MSARIFLGGLLWAVVAGMVLMWMGEVVTGKALIIILMSALFGAFWGYHFHTVHQMKVIIKEYEKHRRFISTFISDVTVRERVSDVLEGAASEWDSILQKKRILEQQGLQGYRQHYGDFGTILGYQQLEAEIRLQLGNAFTRFNNMYEEAREAPYILDLRGNKPESYLGR